MSTDVVVVILIVVEMATIAALLAWDTFRKQPDILTTKTRSKVLVTLKTGEGFLGVLYAHDARSVVLRNASAIGAGEQGTDQTVDGELLVLREDVSYLQVL